MSKSSVLNRPIPAKMISPRPPAPILEASVALATISTAAVLIPVRIMGMASGKRTFCQTCAPVMPSPSAVSSMKGGTVSRPATVFIKIGGTANSTSATTAGAVPVPSNGTISRRIARLGITRSTLNRPVITFCDFGCRTQRKPAGIPISTAIARAIRLTRICAPSIPKKRGPLDSK